MSGAERSPGARPSRQRRPWGEARLTLALWLGMIAMIVPLTRVVTDGAWLVGVTAFPAALLATGFALRRWRTPALGVSLAEIALWVCALTAVFFAPSALFGFLPTPEIIAEVPALVQTAADQIRVGISPLPPSPALTFVIVAAIGLLTIALDHIVLTARMPLLATVALVMVWLIPALAVPAGVDAFAFVALAVCVLLLLRAETRTREGRPQRGGAITALTAATGVTAVVGALLITPALPPLGAGVGGPGPSTTVSASLDLGNDLRSRSTATVLTLRTTADTLPYLRVATLSSFDGDVWSPDRPSAVPLRTAMLDDLSIAESIAAPEETTDIAVTTLNSAYLPLPYPAVGVSGLDDSWWWAAQNRTVTTAGGDARGQSYQVTTRVPEPTSDQIRASAAALDGVGVPTLPLSTPPTIAQLAQDVTRSAQNDYDRLVALQTWFRGPDFTYSLTAPVQEGFDGTGVEAIAAFLDEKEGYCIHFASAFALMARSLGMPVRIVVGFLPGSYTGETIDDRRVAEVRMDQLHAWPEVHFDGIGWVAFEPTKSLGTPTAFSSAAEIPGEQNAPEPEAPTTPVQEPTAAPDLAETENTDTGASAADGMFDPRPLLGGIALALLIMAAPGAAGATRRWMIRRQGTTAAAWRIVQETAIDLGVPVVRSESARMLGARLTDTKGAPPAEMARLVGAVERANYGAPEAAARRDSAAGNRDTPSLADAEQIRRAMLAAASPRRRAAALLLPRALIVRPS